MPSPDTPNDLPLPPGDLDAQLDALTRGDPAQDGPLSRAYRALAAFHAPQAQREAEAIERVRARLAAGAGATETSLATSSLTEEEADLMPTSTPFVADSSPPANATSRPRSGWRGLAAVLVVACLASSFAAVLVGRGLGFGGATISSHQWQVVPSANTPVGVNVLNGIAMRTGTDGWAWGSANETPTNSNSNPVSQPLIEHWDGQAWRIAPSPAFTQSAQINDLVALAADNAWAVGSQLAGDFEHTHGEPLIEHWDGHAWTQVADDTAAYPDSGSLNKIAALAPNDMWAAGGTDLIQHWDGGAWRVVAHPTVRWTGGNRGNTDVQFGALAALAPNDVWVAASAPDPTFLHWDGARWRAVPGADLGSGLFRANIPLAGMSAVAPDDIWLAGRINGLVTAALFEHWDGHQWSVVDGAPAPAGVSAIVALGRDDVWAVGTRDGDFYLDVAQQGHGFVEHWDGQVWTVVVVPQPRGFVELSGVARDLTAPGRIWVAGLMGPPLSDRDQLSDTQTLIETNR
ncbi:MAG TPA: hypothetical protein VGR57_19470 [Ktedonobacterales bacterium]|nr:hypothetical protein [Ktedonobacterales bacterium]